MSASQLFSIANPVALVGWITMIAAVMFKRPFWRDDIAGRWFPIGLSAVYSVLIVFFFFQADGGFDTLENVQKLFTSPWAALAGWIHYLAFDLFMGAIISKRVMEQGLPRWTLIVLLPLTFMFGPMGLVGFEVVKLIFGKSETA
jgi:uncharacterized membrane protein YuzA (DUF378 family)